MATKTDATSFPDTSLAGKIALVTGGSRGIGRNVALRLAEQGADVVVTYRKEEAAARQVVEGIEAHGRRGAALQADLTGTGQVAALADAFRAVLRDWGADGFDVLINNAGVSSHGSVAEVTEEEMDRVYEINFKSGFFVIQALLGDLHDGGRIISTGSGLGRFAIPGLGVYGAFKAALTHLMRYLAKELGPRGITANAVAPGALDTDFNAAAYEHNPQMKDYIASVTALGRVGLAEDVGGVVAFLCSDAARWITGQRIEVSGGMFL
jgi:NAD(P)-dependent dehydrogenase (short-subunit alcohol dehydrogenase family)